MEKPWYRLWPKVYPRSLRYDEGNVVDFLDAAAARFRERPALIFMEKAMSFGELQEQSKRLAAALASLGVKKGDRVGLFMPNCPQFAAAYYGVLRLGAIVTMCSPMNSEAELMHQLNDSGAETIITLKLKLLIDKLMAVKAETGLRRVIVSGIEEALPFLKKYGFLLLKRKEMASLKADPGRGIYSFKDLVNGFPPEPPPVEIQARDDVAVLAYTGGTTGLPKGAMITHYNTIANVSQVANWNAPVFGHDVVESLRPDTCNPQGAHHMAITVVPWFHAMGTIAYLNYPLFVGTTLYVLPRFDPELYLRVLKKYPIDALGGRPLSIRPF